MYYNVHNIPLSRETWRKKYFNPIQGHQKNDLDNFESLSMNYNNLKYASIVQDMKNLRILYLEGNELTFVPKFHDENDVTSFRLDLR